MYDCIIIGLGPAGINASIYAKRSDLNTLVIEKNMPGGTLHNIKEVDNYLGYEHITGSELAKQFYKQFKEQKIKQVSDEVLEINDNINYKEVITKNGRYEARTVIICTGRGAKKLNLKNEDLPGVSTCVLCDGALYKDKTVALYGNKPAVLEEAIYLSGLAKKLYLIINNDKLLGPDNLVNEITTKDNIEIIKNEKITAINGDMKIKEIALTKQKLEIDGLFINNEYGPLTDFCKNLNITDDKGYIIVDEKGCTNVPGIFACGDSTKKEIYQIITAASEGATCAISAYKYVKNIK